MGEWCVHVSLCMCVLCVYIYNYCLLCGNGKPQYLRLFVEVYVNVVFVISRAYSAASLTLDRE